MMKKICVGMLAAALVMMQPITSLGARSISSSVSSGGGSGAGTGASKDYQLKGDSYKVSGNGTVVTSSGESISSDRLSLMIIDGPGGRLGITEELNAKFQAINGGKTPLNQIITDIDVTGYYALAATNYLEMKDSQTEQTVTASVSMNLYVPNLIESLGTVQILFCDHATGKWSLITPSALDFENKTVIVEMPSAGTFCVVYKK